MNWNLSDYANFAQIISIPLTIALWFFTRKHVTDFWQKWWKLIFGLLAIVTLVAVWRLDWFGWLSHSATLSVWVLILLFFCGSLLTFVAWAVASSLGGKPSMRTEISQSEQPEQEGGYRAQSAQLDWHSFVSDEIFGVLWRWSYRGNTIDDFALSAFCPRQDCMNRLETGFDPENPNYGRQPHTFPETMSCHRCGFKRHFDCDSQTMKHRVISEIERLVNTGQFVQRLKA